MDKYFFALSQFLIAFMFSCGQTIERSPTEYSWISKILSGQSLTTSQTSGANPTNPNIPNVTPFSVAYSLSQYVYPANTAITALTPIVTGTMTTCAVTPSLPTGLTLDSTTCSITGMPTTSAGPTTYTISATGTTGSATANISIRISSTTAFRVFGQFGNFTTGTLNNGGISANSLAQPSSLRADTFGNLVVSDFNNRRVLYYPASSIALGGNITATKVYGQYGDFSCAANFNNGACGSSAPTASNMGAPQSVTLDDGGNVYVDGGNRVLFFSSDANLPAARVYGQVTSTNFTCAVDNNNGSCVSGTPTASANTLGSVQQMVVDNLGGIYVCDSGNNRVLYYSNGSTTATRVYGQFGSFTCTMANNNGSCSGSAISANSLNLPVGVALDSANNLYISDMNNNRVLFFPTGSTTATIVYGQSGNFTTASSSLSASTFNQPWMIAMDRNDNLYVTDYNNKRVLYFPKSSVTATRVYGQSNFTSNAVNNGGLTTGLNNAQAVSVDGYGNVYIADTGNNRVVMY
jgi:Putative Ig domain/NHL repeat